MWRIILALWLALAPAWADGISVPGVPRIGGDAAFSYPPSAGGGGCSQATTFLARTSGLGATEISAYTYLICTLVTDGVITGNMTTTGCGSILDGLYWFATNTTTSANLNICDSSYSLAQTGTVTFAADHGYTGDGSTGYLNSNFVPSTAGGNMAQNSATVGVYVLTNRTTTSTIDNEIGAANTTATSYIYIEPNYTGNVTSYDVNGYTFPSSSSVTTSKGHWLATRTASATVGIYLNGSSIGSTSDTSVALINNSIYIGAYNSAPTGPLGFSNDQIAAAYFGAGVTATQAGYIDAAINGAATIMGINVH